MQTYLQEKYGIENQVMLETEPAFLFTLDDGGEQGE